MIKIVVHGSNSIVLAGLVAAINQQENLQVVASSVHETSWMSAIAQQPDLIILEQPSDADLWSHSTVLPTDFDLPIILLTEALTVEEIGEYYQFGVKGFLPRLMGATEAIAAINAVVAGLIVVHPDLASFPNSSAITPLPESIALTARENEVLQLLAAGLNNKAIAHNLQISPHTVKFHISSILSKLDVSSRTQAVTLGLRQGLIWL